MSINKQFFEQVWTIFGPLRWRILLTLTLIALGQALELIGPYIQGLIVDNITEKRDINEIYWLVGLAGIIWLLALWIPGYLRERHEIKNLDFEIDEAASDQTMAKMLGLSIGQHNASHTGVKQSVINRGQHSLTTLVNLFIYDIVPTLSRAIIMTVAMFWLSQAMGLIVIGTLILFLAITFTTNYFFGDRLKKLEKMWNQESKVRNEILYNIGHVLANAQEKRARQEADAKYKETVTIAKPLWLKFCFYGHTKGTVIVIARVAILALGPIYVYNGQHTIGEIVIFWAWSKSALDGLWSIGNMHRQVMKMWTSIKRYCHFLSIEPEIKVIANPVVLVPLKGHVEFRNVSFKYENRMLIPHEDDEEDDEPKKEEEEDTKESSLQNISLTIAPGETVAIVGRSGSGKSTLANLLIRASDPKEGQILIDGQDLRVIDLHTYRLQVGIVEQHVPLFDQTIRYNILYGLNGKARNITGQEMERIVEISQISRFSHKLESGLDTLIGERGVKLSGGERQRVGIARALIKNPAILIFDEATSSLDAEVEAEIREAMREVSRNRTTIIIAHRFSTIRYANRIVVMDEGRIAGQGTHTELYNSCNQYKRLVDHQIMQSKNEFDWDEFNKHSAPILTEPN